MNKRSMEKLKEKLADPDIEVFIGKLFQCTKAAKKDNGLSYHQFKDMLFMFYEKKEKEKIKDLERALMEYQYGEGRG